MTVLEKNNGLKSLITWDWKETPPWTEVQKALDKINKVNQQPFIFNINTGSDEYAIIVAPINNTPAEIQRMYNDSEIYFDWD